MAMIVCPHCGEQVSEKAKKCVHCGEILILEEKKHCTECGVELEEGMTECPNCGCPVDDTIGQETDEKPQKVEVTGVKVTKKIKVIIGIVIALLVVGGATVFGVTQYQKKKAAEEYAQRVEEYSDNLNLATVTMLTGASDAESSANLIKQVWYNAIYEKRDDETDKYTRPKGYFVSDFNDALGNLYADSSFSSKVRIKEWKYTEKGWFGYELCVPEPPEVTEIVDGSCLVRIKPMTKEQREMSEKCVQGLGYQGNNLLCSNWDTDHMEKLDYNGMYEYLFAMKYHKAFDAEDYPNGIPKEEFESLIMEYLPVTAEQIQEYAVFDEKNQTYVWVRLGCLNYAPTFFGTSLPEVIDIKENEDGTVTLTVDAVCDMVICDDAVITHELTVKFADDGSFQYLGNEILNDGIKEIPDYQYRINVN